MRTSLGRFIYEQSDVRNTVEELARHVDAIRDGTHPRESSSATATQSDASVALPLEIDDLKAKVTCLTEQSTQHTAQLGVLPTLSEKVDLAENQILRWRYRLPELTNDDEQQPIVTAVEVQEQLNKFQELTRSKTHEIRQETNSIEGKIRILEIARSESWELISQRLNSLLERSVGTLSERMTDLEQTVQSQRTTPVTEASGPQVSSEAVASIESGIEARYQAFSHEVERLKDEWDPAIAGQCDLLDYLERKQNAMDKQVRGLKSFAWHVERFLEQHTQGGGATAPDVSAEHGSRSARERQEVAAEHTSGASSSSTRPLLYVRISEPVSDQAFLRHLFLAGHYHLLRPNQLEQPTSALCRGHSYRHR